MLPKKHSDAHRLFEACKADSVRIEAVREQEVSKVA